MKTVMLTMASGRFATGVIKALRYSEEEFHLIGLDSDPVNILVADLDERILVPRITDDRFYPLVRQLIAEHKPDFFWPIHDDEMPVFAGMDDLEAPTFLPPVDVFTLTQDKMASYLHFKEHDVPVPETLFVNTEDDLKEAMERFGNDVWLRAYIGFGSKGALRVSSLDDAIAWLNLNDGWGSFTAAQRMPGADSVVEMVWYRGELLFSQSRTRGRGTPGTVGASRRWRRNASVGAPPAVTEVGIQAVKSVMQEPHGLFFVDQKLDEKGIPRVTEVNAGRFSTNGIIYWYDVTLNVAELVVNLALGEEHGITTPVMDTAPEDVYRVNGDEFPVMFVPKSAPKALEADLEQRLKEL